MFTSYLVFFISLSWRQFLFSPNCLKKKRKQFCYYCCWIISMQKDTGNDRDSAEMYATNTVDALSAAALPFMHSCYHLNILSGEKRPTEGQNIAFDKKKKGKHLRHLVVMFACEYPLSLPPLKDKPGQGLSPTCQSKNSQLSHASSTWKGLGIWIVGQAKGNMGRRLS